MSGGLKAAWHNWILDQMAPAEVEEAGRVLQAKQWSCGLTWRKWFIKEGFETSYHSQFYIFKDHSGVEYVLNKIRDRKR